MTNVESAEVTVPVILSDDTAAPDVPVAAKPARKPRKPRVKKPAVTKPEPAPAVEPPAVVPTPVPEPVVTKRDVAEVVKTAATVVMGCAIPALSLTLSHAGGTLADLHPRLGAMGFGLMGCVLAVSLGHLAWAVGDITRSPRWASWLLAIAFDLCLVFAELVGVLASGAGLGALMAGLTVGVAGLSMFLNVWAFLRHPTE